MKTPQNSLDSLSVYRLRKMLRASLAYEGPDGPFVRILQRAIDRALAKRKQNGGRK